MSEESGQDLRWARPRLDQVPTDRIRMQLEFYEESILLRGHQSNTTWVRRVDPDEMASTLMKHMGAKSGLLPPGTLWWKQSSEGTLTAVWREPAVWQVAVQAKAFEKPERLRLPMPGLVFLCAPGRPPWAFAAPERPTSQDDKLYHMPTFNVFQSGRVCPGNHTFPEEPDGIPESFFQSHFSLTGDSRGRSKKYPRELAKLWEEIDGKDEYPMEDLVEFAALAEVMGIPEKPPSHQFRWE